MSSSARNLQPKLEIHETGETRMAPKTIVSYDDTLNDHDALALARVLAKAGATLELAYVRHTT